MWKHFVFGLIVVAIGWMYIFTKSHPKRSTVGAADGGVTILHVVIEEDGESLENFTSLEQELEKMLLPTNSFTYSLIGSDSARWN